MQNNDKPTEVRTKYAAAYTAHYEEQNLRDAFERYRHIIATHEHTQEAGYAQAQINNIINSVVPKKDLFDAQANLLLSHLDKHQPDLKVNKN